MAAQVYRLHGVTFTTETPLATVAAVGATRHDIAVSRGAPASARGEALYAMGEGEPVFQVFRCTDGYLVDVAHRGEFVVSSGRIVAAPEADLPALAFEQTLVDVILPRAMQLIGQPCFHASAALVDGRAVAFAGDSGAGKSTLCAALAQRGRVVTDDSLALRVTPESIDAWPGYASLRLWPASAAALVGDTSRLEPVSPRTSKLRLPAELAVEPAPLGHFFVLERGAASGAARDGTAGSARIERLSPHDAFTALSRCLHRLAPDDPAAMRAEFRLLGEVSARVPVSRLSFAHDFDALPALVERIVSLSR